MSQHPTTALLLIDIQESFRHRPSWSEHDLPAFLARTHALIDGCASRGLPLVRIFHVEPEGPFSMASGQVRPLQGLAAVTPAVEFHKNRHSALVGTGLSVWLRQRNINRLIVAGIRTEQCCETTTRHASDLGWSVDYVLDATLTFDMTQPDGRPLSAADIKARTATVLEGRFAKICSVEQALERAGALAVA